MKYWKLKNFLAVASLFSLCNYNPALAKIESQDIHPERHKSLINNAKKSDFEIDNLKKLEHLFDIKTKIANSKYEKEKKVNKIPKIKINNSKNKILEKRSLKIDETFILTDKTRANTFRISSGTKWKNFKDNLLISFDIFGQESDDGNTKLKKQRFEFNYFLSFLNFHENEPFVEYYYSTDMPTNNSWKVLSMGIGKKFPLDLKFDLGYGFKWGEITKTEIYKYDVITANLRNKRKISHFIVTQNIKVISPRIVKNNKQPIYDYKGTLSVPIANNLNGTISFDWRYQKIPELKKEDWSSYSLKFGLTFFPRK